MGPPPRIHELRRGAMSRYDDPDRTGGKPASGKRRALRGRRRSSDDGGSRGSRGQAAGDHPARPGGPGYPGQQRRRGPLLGSHPVLGAAAIIATVLVVGVSLVAYAAVRDVYDGINHEAVTAQMLGKRPPKLNGSTNILLVGSDSRAGSKRKFGRDVMGSRSDTTMPLHVTPDHTHAYVISFPRDSMVPVAVHNAQANLNISAGLHKVYGAQALAFVRLRENIGDGSDLQRIQRQQLFMASAMQKIKQTNLLADYNVIKDAAHAVTTDLTLTDMLGIANSVKGLGTQAMRFVSVPVVPYTLDMNKVQWEQPQAGALFSAIAHDN